MVYSFLTLIFTVADIIHSFFLPDYGIKVDCVPGRLNQTIIYPKKIGVFYEYCAELCGVNHRFLCPLLLKSFLKELG